MCKQSVAQITPRHDRAYVLKVPGYGEHRYHSEEIANLPSSFFGRKHTVRYFIEDPKKPVSVYDGKVFLGDAGSTLLGFAVVWFALQLTQNTQHPVSPVLAPWMIALPVLDTVVLMLDRIRQGRSPFSPDRNHMHHLMLDAGFSPTYIALAMMLLSIVLGCTAAIAVKYGATRTWVVLAYFALIGLYWAFSFNRQRAVATFRFLRTGGKKSVAQFDEEEAKEINSA